MTGNLDGLTSGLLRSGAGRLALSQCFRDERPRFSKRPLEGPQRSPEVNRRNPDCRSKAGRAETAALKRVSFGRRERLLELAPGADSLPFAAVFP